MPKLQLHIQRSKGQWDELYAAARKQGVTFAKFLRVKLIQEFNSTVKCEPCENPMLVRSRKHFDIDLPPEVIAKIKCNAANLNISHDEFVVSVLNK